jgi:hypothetical protein
MACTLLFWTSKYASHPSFLKGTRCFVYLPHFFLSRFVYFLIDIPVLWNSGLRIIVDPAFIYPVKGIYVFAPSLADKEQFWLSIHSFWVLNFSGDMISTFWIDGG